MSQTARDACLFFIPDICIAIVIAHGNFIVKKAQNTRPAKFSSPALVLHLSFPGVRTKREKEHLFLQPHYFTSLYVSLCKTSYKMFLVYDPHAVKSIFCHFHLVQFQSSLWCPDTLFGAQTLPTVLCLKKKKKSNVGLLICSLKLFTCHYNRECTRLTQLAF